MNLPDVPANVGRERAEARLAKLSECFLRFGADPLENINLLTALCGELTGATCALYNRLDDNGLLCSWGQWHTPADYRAVDHPQGHICYDLITQASDQVVVIRDLPRTLYFQSDPNVAQYALQTYVGKVVKFEQRAVGSLCTVFQSDYDPDANDQHVFDVIAAAIGIEEKRRQDKLELEQREDRFRALVQNSSDIISVHDATGVIRYVSPSVTRMLGYAPEDLIGKNVFDLVHPEDIATVRASFLHTAQYGSRGIAPEFRFRAPNGEWVYLESLGNNLLATSSVQGVVLNTRNTTERKHIAEALQASERRNSAMLQAFPDAMLVVARDGIITDARVPKSTGISPGEVLIGHQLAEMGMSELALEHILQKIHAAIDTGVMQSYEYEFQSAQSVTFWDARAVPLDADHALIIIRDITQRKRAERRSQIFSALGHHLSSATTPYQAGLIIVQLANELLGWDACYFDLYMTETNTITPVLAMDIIEGKRTECALPQRDRPGPTAQRVLQEGAVLIQRFDPRDASPLERFGDTTRYSASIMAVPIRQGTTVIGFLSIQSYTPNAYTQADVDTLQALADHAGGALERLRVQEAWRASEKRFRALIENSVDVITLLSEHGTILYESPSMVRAFGAQPELLVGKSLLEILDTFNVEYDLAQFEQIVASPGTTIPIVTSYRHHDGSRRWLEGVATNLLGEPSVQAIVLNYRDVTARKLAEAELRASLEEQTVLLKEIHHRVKNNLQVVSSLLSLQARQVQDPTSLEMLRDSQNRIRSMALVHEKLYQTQDLARVDFAGYLQNLTAFLFHAYQVDAAEIVLQVSADSAVRLGIDAAIPCGLIVNELVSNALKHAFPHKRPGKVWIALTRQADQRLQLVVGDDGVGLPPDLDIRNTTSLGLQLVNTLTDQLEGTLTVARERGTVFEITFASGA